MTPARRIELDDKGVLPETAGDLTYELHVRALAQPAALDRAAFSRAVTDVVEGFLPEVPRFADLCAVVGACNCCAYEVLRRRPGHESWCAADELRDWCDDFYRDALCPYEDKAIARNGDVT
jgi:hypothetical protein